MLMLILGEVTSWKMQWDANLRHMKHHATTSRTQQEKDTSDGTGRSGFDRQVHPDKEGCSRQSVDNFECNFGSVENEEVQCDWDFRKWRKPPPGRSHLGLRAGRGFCPHAGGVLHAWGGRHVPLPFLFAACESEGALPTTASPGLHHAFFPDVEVDISEAIQVQLEMVSSFFGATGFSSRGSEVRFEVGNARFGQGAGSQCLGRPVRTEPDDVASLTLLSGDHTLYVLLLGRKGLSRQVSELMYAVGSVRWEQQVFQKKGQDHNRRERVFQKKHRHFQDTDTEEANLWNNKTLAEMFGQSKRGRDSKVVATIRGGKFAHAVAADNEPALTLGIGRTQSMGVCPPWWHLNSLVRPGTRNTSNTCCPTEFFQRTVSTPLAMDRDHVVALFKIEFEKRAMYTPTLGRSPLRYRTSLPLKRTRRN